MIRLLSDLPENVVGIEVSGTVTDDDYERVLVPAVRERLASVGAIRIVYVIGKDFDGWTMGAMWEDAKLGLGELKEWERVAVVTDKDWVRHVVGAIGWMVPGDVRVFGLDGLEDAKAWAAA